MNNICIDKSPHIGRVVSGAHIAQTIDVRNNTINAMVKALPKKEYDPKFIEWFVNFHAEMLCIEYWETFPRWMIPRLKKRAEEIHEGLHFNR